MDGKNDNNTSVEALRRIVHEFVDARDWQQFHSPKNLSMALAIEAAELMEHFQWITQGESREIGGDAAKLEGVRDELADVLCYVIAIANELDIDLSSALRGKMVKNITKYPVKEYRGRYGPEDDSKPTVAPPESNP